MDDKAKESTIGCMVFGGLIAAGLGLVITIFLYLGAAATLLKRGDASLWAIRGLGPGLILLGLLSAVGGLLLGIREGRRTTSGKGRIYTDPNARVVARFAEGKDGNMVHDEWLFDQLDGLKFFVKIEHADGRVKEYQTSRTVLQMCGEGMRGAATFDGRWLGGFVPQIGS